MKLQVLDTITLPGSGERANEDACGQAGDWAWIIDGFIPSGFEPFLHPSSDAAWFTSYASEQFAARATGADDGPTLVRQVIEDAREAFLKSAPDGRHDPMSWPGGALTLMRLSRDRLDFWTLADTVAYVQTKAGATSTIGPAEVLRQAESAKAADLLRRTGSRPGAILSEPLFTEWLHANRRRQIESGKAAVFSLWPEAADRLVHNSLTVEEGTAVLLATDGFSALVELYGAHSPERLVASALTQGLEALIRELRHIETEVDPDGRRFPRFKVSDDATALLMQVSQENIHIKWLSAILDKSL